MDIGPIDNKEVQDMLVDREKISRIADPARTKPKPVRVRKLDKTRDPDGVYDLVNELHAIHIGISLEKDIVCYGLIKALSEKYDRKPGDRFDRWPSATPQDFEKATRDWVRRSRYIGDCLESFLEELKNLGYLRICQCDGEIYMAFTKKAVFLILKTVGLYTDMKFISY